jgi:hypothetical protein
MSSGVDSIHLEEATVQISVDFDHQKVEIALYNFFHLEQLYLRSATLTIRESQGIAATTLSLKLPESLWF